MKRVNLFRLSFRLSFKGFISGFISGFFRVSLGLGCLLEFHLGFLRSQSGASLGLHAG